MAECVFEKFSVDNLLKPKEITGWRSMVKEALKQGGIEASEEMLTECANIISDAMVMGERSGLATAIQAYQEQGMSEDKAVLQACLDNIGQVAWAGAGGFLSGVGMGGGKIAMEQGGQAIYDSVTKWRGDNAKFDVRTGAEAAKPGEYRLNEPRNIEMPTVPIITMSVNDIPEQTSLSLTAGNSLRPAAIERARKRLGLDQNSAAYIPASNVMRDGNEYVLKITKASLTKMLSPTDGGAVPLESIVVMDNLERIANNGVWFDGQGDRKGRAQIAGFDHLKTTVYIDSVPYEVDMRVRLVEETPGKGADNVLYYFTPEEILTIEKVGTEPPTYGRRASVSHSEAMPTFNDSIPQPTQEVNPSSLENPEQAGTLLSEAYDLARRIDPYGKTGLSEALGVRVLGGDFDETDFLIGYLDVYLAARSGVPHGPAYLPATVDSHARHLTLVERMQAYHNGLNDAKARTQAAREGKPEAGISQTTTQGDGGKVLYADTSSLEGAQKASAKKDSPPVVLKTTLEVDSDLVSGVIPKGAEIKSVRIIAGGSSKTPVKASKYLAEKYGGLPLQWIKMGGIIKTDNFHYDVHWFELDGEHYDEKLKGVKKNEG